MSLTIAPQCAGFCIKLSCSAVPNLISIFCILTLLLLLGVAGLGFLVTNLHGFLAKNDPIVTDVLVVEGWLPDYALAAALCEFRQGKYLQLVTIGGPIPHGSYLFSYQTFAELAVATLNALGLEPEYLLAVPDNSTGTSRTYDSATALKEWLPSANLEINSLNLLTLGTHSRRSWLLFNKAFEPHVKIGAIAIEPLHYDPQQWWKSSEGSRTIVSEFIAYLYTRLFMISTRSK
jgi:hypothetical protein